MSTSNSNISRFLPNDEYQAAIGANAPSAGNVFATMADVGGTSIYTSDDTIGAGRKATLTDTLTFSLGGAATIDTAGLLNIVSNADATYLRIENQSRAATHHRALEITETGNDIDFLMNAHLGMSSLTLIETNANGIKLVSSDGLGGAGFEGVGTVTGLSLDLADIHPKAVGGTTIGTSSRPFNDMYLTSGGYDFIQTTAVSSNIEFQLGNTRDDGVNNKSSFYLTAPSAYANSHYFSVGITTSTKFTIGPDGAIGINLGGSPAFAISPNATIDAITTGNTSATKGLSITNSSALEMMYLQDDGVLFLRDTNDHLVIKGGATTGNGVHIGRNVDALTGTVGTSSIIIGDKSGAAAEDYGVNSVNIGLNARANGLAGIAIGNGSQAVSAEGISLGNATGRTTGTVGNQNISIGYFANQGTTDIGARSVAIGYICDSIGADSLVIGRSSVSNGNNGMAIGFQTESGTGAHALAIGNWVNSNAAGAMTIGSGVSNASKLTNTTVDSLALGSNSATPIMYILASNVGIGMSAGMNSAFNVTGDAEIYGSANGIILESPDNTRWRVTIDNTGALDTNTV